MQYPDYAYIHIPFCNSKCSYCAFTSTCNTNLLSDYLTSLVKEIDTNYKNNTLSTLYFGGGTPSILNAEEVKNIINRFKLTNNSEITFEVNPEHADERYFRNLIDIGVNRISIGIQTLNDNILKQIGRKHSAQEAINCIKIAKKSGFKNVSVDLIYGLPNQTIKIFKQDLNTIKKCDIQHISLYGLKIEENSIFGKKIPENLPDDDTQADMYLEAVKTLDKFFHYEISNFALSDKYFSKHNISYWKNKEYYGFGCSAHGYENGVRYANTSDLHEYIQNPLTHKFEHTETTDEKLQEEIFLGLRLSDGINVKSINNKYKINLYAKYKNVIDKYVQSGHMQTTADGYKLSAKGFLVSTIILADFI